MTLACCSSCLSGSSTGPASSPQEGASQDPTLAFLHRVYPSPGVIPPPGHWPHAHPDLLQISVQVYMGLGPITQSHKRCQVESKGWSLPASSCLIPVMHIGSASIQQACSDDYCHRVPSGRYWVPRGRSINLPSGSYVPMPLTPKPSHFPSSNVWKESIVRG